MDTEWVLQVPVKVTKTGYGAYRVEELNGTRKLELTFLGTRLHFDGKYIETEDYMAYLGLCDAANESPNGVAIFEDTEE
jgi:hypothetical protein